MASVEINLRFKNQDKLKLKEMKIAEKLAEKLRTNVDKARVNAEKEANRLKEEATQFLKKQEIDAKTHEKFTLMADEFEK